MTQSSVVYLDHAATSPTDPRVVEAMLPDFTQHFGNPSSVYRIGTLSQEAVNRARETIADLLGADRREIIFTASGSEAINLAIKGVSLAQRKLGKGNHVITSAIEHHATLHAVEALEHMGFETTVLPVDQYGRVSIDDLKAALRPETVLVSIMHANNEIGTVQPIEAIGALCRERAVPFHVDAVQAVGALPIDVDTLGASLLSMSGHKFYGPKGTGLLYVRTGTPLAPIIDGGAQEFKRRAGTENVPGIVSIATALRLAVEKRVASAEHCLRLRNRIIEGITTKIPHTALNGHPTERHPNNVHVTFDYLEGNAATESILRQLDAQGVCASTGSACNSRALEPSHVLKAIGLTPSRAFSSLRLTVGRENTEDEIDRVLVCQLGSRQAPPQGITCVSAVLGRVGALGWIRWLIYNAARPHRRHGGDRGRMRPAIRASRPCLGPRGSRCFGARFGGAKRGRSRRHEGGRRPPA